MNIGKYLQLYSEELSFKNYSSNTIKNYSFQLEMFFKNFDNVATKPSEISEKQIKDYLMRFKTRNSMCHAISSLKLFYKMVVKQPLKFRYIEYPRAEKKLPLVIDHKHLLDCISKINNLKHKSIISLAYSTAMRVSEVCNLKISDIDSNRMVINIRNAKGNKDRIVPLSPTILDLLRIYFKEYKPVEFLFNGQFSNQYSHKSCNEIVKKYLGKSFHFHQLRHSSATTLVENGTDINLIQKILGHSNVKTTLIYTHISTQVLSKINLAL